MDPNYFFPIFVILFILFYVLLKDLDGLLNSCISFEDKNDSDGLLGGSVKKFRNKQIIYIKVLFSSVEVDRATVRQVRKNSMLIALIVLLVSYLLIILAVNST